MRTLSPDQVRDQALDRRVEREAQLLLEDYGAERTAADIEAVIRRQIELFGGEARMGSVDRKVLWALRLMARRASEGVGEAHSLLTVH